MKTFSVPGMTCGGCAAGVRAALADLPGVEAVEADPAARQVRVTGPASAEAIEQALAQAGYTVAKGA